MTPIRCTVRRERMRPQYIRPEGSNLNDLHQGARRDGPRTTLASNPDYKMTICAQKFCERTHHTPQLVVIT